MDRKKPYWANGAQKQVALKLGISHHAINDILHRRIGVSTKRAKLLEKTTGIAAIEWLYNRTSTHKAFYGKPQVIA